MTHDDLVAVLLLLGVGAVDVAAEGGLDASPVFVILLEDGTQGEIRPPDRAIASRGADAEDEGGASFQKGVPPVLEIRPATHPRGSAPTHRLVTAARKLPHAAARAATT